MSTAPARIQMRPLTWLLIAIAIVFVVIAVVYFVTPANQLPGFFPGHTAHATRAHTKHGIAALGVAVVALIGAWFTTAPARATA
jgi:amino acid permease